MEKRSSKPPRDRSERASAEESLDAALSSLEQLLDGEGRAPPATPAPDPEPAEAPPAPQVDGQYTIPLLHDVVVPGADNDHGAKSEPLDREAVEDHEEACRHLVERLANEIEVIVQSRVEAAVQDAAGDIRTQIRNHLEIMLPEILEELNLLGRDRRG